MSTHSTYKAVQDCRITEQTLQSLQENIVRQRTEVIALATKLHFIYNKKSFTQKEFYEQQELIKFTKRQLNESRRSLNYIEKKAYAIAKILGVSM